MRYEVDCDKLKQGEAEKMKLELNGLEEYLLEQTENFKKSLDEDSSNFNNPKSMKSKYFFEDITKKIVFPQTEYFFIDQKEKSKYIDEAKGMIKNAIDEINNYIKNEN